MNFMIWTRRVVTGLGGIIVPISACVATESSEPRVQEVVSHLDGLVTVTSRQTAPNAQMTGWNHSAVGDNVQVSPDGAIFLSTPEKSANTFTLGRVKPLEEAIEFNGTDTDEVNAFHLDNVLDLTNVISLPAPDINIDDNIFRIGAMSALTFDPRAGNSVIRVQNAADCAQAAPTFVPNGPFECRKFLVYAEALPANVPEFCNCDSPATLRCTECYPPVYIVVAPLSVVTNTATSIWSTTSLAFVPIATTDGYIRIDQGKLDPTCAVLKDTAFREHLTATADGRLLVYWSFENGMQYTYSPYTNATLGAGFTTPKSLWKINHDVTPTPQGAPFREVYPIARQAIRYPNGTLVAGASQGAETTVENTMGCGYPWISTDGSDIFCAAGNLSALITFGAETKGIIKHIDSQVQTTQGRYCNRVVTDKLADPVVTESCDPGLASGPRRDCSNGDQQSDCDGEVGIQNLTSLGMATGFWRSVNSSRSARPSLPLNRRTPVRSMVARNTALKYFGPDPTHGFIYFEVANDDFNDEAFDVFFHMNEPVLPNAAGEIDKYDPFQRSTWTSQNPAKTADTSKNGYLATLRSNAEYPFEKDDYFESKDSPNPGFLGRAVHFRKSSKIMLDNSATDFLAEGRTSLTMELAIKPENAPSDNVNGTMLVYAPSSFTFRIAANGDFIFEVPGATGLPARWIKDAINLNTNEWTHFALTYQVDGANPLAAKVRLFKNAQAVGGDQMLTFATSATLQEPSGGSKLCIGPGCNGNTGPNGLSLWIDEVAISSIVRSDAYLAAAAFAHHEVPQIHAPTAGDVFPPLLGPLPKGLSALDLRIPKDVWALFTNVPEDTTRKTRFDAISALGGSLFADTLLSLYLKPNGDPAVRSHYLRNNRSCASCHAPTNAFANPCVKFDCALPLPTNGSPCTELPINTPTLINRAFSIEQFLDKRSPNLLEQVVEPINSQIEMGGNVYDIAKFIRDHNAKPSSTACPSCDSTLTYRAWFRQAFGNPSLYVNENVIAQALTVYLLGRIAGGSPADFIREGLVPPGYDQTAINQVVRGLQLFEGKGRCSACHQGSNFSDELMHASGPSGIKTKTPTLRHLDKTGPYFRDGSKSSLGEVVAFYSSGDCRVNGCDPEQFPLGLTPSEQADLVKFLEALGSQTAPVSCPPPAP